MIAEQQQITSAEARDRLDDFLRRHFGPDVEHPKLGPVAIREDRTREYANAYGFSVDTTRFIESGDVRDGLMSGAIIVPRMVPLSTGPDILEHLPNTWMRWLRASAGGLPPVPPPHRRSLLRPHHLRAHSGEPERRDASSDRRRSHGR
ncbi:MAG TPA: YrhB domain-containing protein [Pseudonocardiaceae bacterium]|nr:YrhB domain-containing protein [Pseudonocardiaceae bacterium]